FVERYKLGECLGSGGFGFVCSAFSKLNEEVAVKFILKEKVPNGSWTRDETLGIVPKEIYLLKHLNHPNIIRFLDAFEDHLYFLLVTELHGGSWSQLRPNSPEDSSSPQALRRRPSSDLFECIELLKSLSEPQARHVFQQLLDVVAHLETFGILHRDIKDENILIDDNFNVKLIDFGSASFANQVSDRLFLGTLQYAAPEILEGRQHQGAKCEVWSLACCLYIMLVGEAPFETPRDVRSSKPTALRERSPSLSQPCKELLTWMFEKDPWRRPTITQILNHPWVLDARSA
ncbi:kinase-like domain-containing protein, partial [Zopfochytrium polystomum]